MKVVYTDIDIINGIKQNDDKYLKYLYLDKKIKDLITKHVLSNSGGYDDAIDIYQETILFFYEKLQSDSDFKLTSALSTYLFGVAKFKWLKKLTKNNATISLPESLNEYSDDNSNENSIKSERVELIIENFKKLNKSCQEILMEFYYFKKNMKEIAIKLNYSKLSKNKLLEKGFLLFHFLWWLFQLEDDSQKLRP